MSFRFRTVYKQDNENIFRRDASQNIIGIGWILWRSLTPPECAPHSLFLGSLEESVVFIFADSTVPFLPRKLYEITEEIHYFG